MTRLDLDPDKLLSKAIGKLSSVVIIGYDDKDDFYFASSSADGGNILWFLELAKHRLIRQTDD